MAPPRRRGVLSGNDSGPRSTEDRSAAGHGEVAPENVGPTGAVLSVCVVCRRPAPDLAEGYDEPGRGLLAALRVRLAGAPGLAVEGVDCLAVCKRPCTVALAGPGRWTYVVGDLDADADLDDIAAAARCYAATDNGIIPWRERPPSFRKGVVARVPPLPSAKDRSA